MKKIFATLVVLTTLIYINACKKDEGRLPEIHFKTGGNYISKNDSITAGSPILIGIDASKSEDKDVLKKFNISKKINSGSFVSIYSIDLGKSEEDNYSYDFNSNLDTTKGQSTIYAFNVTNRDGLSNSITITLVGK